MIPGHFNLNTELTEKMQNLSSGSKTPKQSMLRKLDLNWDRKLEKLLNNTDDQVYSDPSNTTISTICLKSNDSRFTDSCWSDTDATRRDDIVITLPERAFYNTKVNPFPQLNFPPKSSPEKNLSKIVENDDQSTETVAPTDSVTEVDIDVRLNDDSDVTNVALNEIVDDLTYEDIALLDAANGNADVQDNESLPCCPNTIEIDIKDDPTNEVLPSVVDGAENMTNEDNHESADGTGKGQDSKESATADGVSPEFVDSGNLNETLIQTDVSANEVKNVFYEEPNLNLIQNTEDLTPPIKDHANAEEQQVNENLIEALLDDATNAAEEQPNNEDLPNANMDKSGIIDDQSQTHSVIPDDTATQIQVAEKISVPEVKKESKSLVRTISTSSRNENVGEVKKNDSKLRPISSLSTSSKNNSSLELRKKRYRKTVDSNHRKNMERQLSKSSGCTKVTSTTTVHVTTNDDSVFDALADMPGFINSSVIDLASSYIEKRMRQEHNQRTRCIDIDSALPSSSSSCTPSWRNDKVSSIYDEYISPREAYKQLNILLKDGTNENLKAVMYDEYNGIRFDDDVASSEDEFLSDVDDLNLTNTNWTPPESELRRQVAIILKKIHPLENNYSTIIDDILCKYLNYIHAKQRIAKVNRIVECVNKPVSQQEKTEMLIRREIDDKKLNREFYHSPMEPADFTELGERRREAIIRKYQRCHNDRKFCYSYFRRSIDDRAVSKLSWRIAKLKRELELIFA